MIFYNLRIGSFNLKYTPLTPNKKDYESCNSNGEILKKVIESSAVTYFVDDSGTQYSKDRVFKLINNKPMAKLSKTKEVDNYKEVNFSEVEDLLVEKIYFVECDSLYHELKTTGKALKFAFTFGNGYKIYFGYIHTSNLYEGFLFMSCGTTQKSELLKTITETQKLKKKSEQVDLVVSGIDRAKVEDLIQL